jgi:hypothetical protein
VTQRQGSQRTREFKNPLAQAFGLVLYRIRRSSGLSTQATAAAIGIADAGYRLIEAGSAVFQPGHSLSLVNLFVELEWGRVALALSAIQILEREREDASLMERRAEDVRALDPGLEAIIERLRPTWTLIKERKDDATGVAYLLENNGVVDALHRYLKQPLVHGFLQAGEDEFGGVPFPSLLGVIEKISPFHFDMVVQQVRELSEFPPFVSPGALANWEHRHHARISRIYGIVAEPRILELSDASGSAFNWQYVWRESFEGAFILSLDHPEQVPDVATALCQSLLSKATKQTSDARERSRELLRKRIVIEPADGIDICANLAALMDAQYLTPELVSGDTSSNWKYRNIWLYHMSDTDTVVGFADTSGPSESSSYTSAMLSFRSVMRVLHATEAYWHTLLADRKLPLLGPTSAKQRTKRDGGRNA